MLVVCQVEAQSPSILGDVQFVEQGRVVEVWQDTGLDDFDRLVETLLEWGDEIFNFHTVDRVTTGRIEGSNNKLGTFKRFAYGFTNTTNFAA